MKRLLTIGVLYVSFGIASLSCQQKDAPSASCPNAGAYVKRVGGSRGEVYFDATQQRWFIRMPNSFDSHDIGYACNLGSEFQKDGLAVRFSGSYYGYDQTVSGIAGNKYFYLSLDSVSLL